MTVPASANDVLTLIRTFADSTPRPLPSLLRVGPYVAGVLLRSAPRGDARHDAFGLPPGVAIVTDDSYRPGEWRLLDQRGEVLVEGHLWPADFSIVESDLLPDNVHAMIYSPPDDLRGAEPCVFVRPGDPTAVTA